MKAILKFEFDKILKNPTIIGSLITGVLVLSGIFFVGYHYSQTLSSEKDNIQAGYAANIDNKIDTKYSGDFTDEKVKVILDDYMNLYQENQEKNQKDSLKFPFYIFYWEVKSVFFPKNDDIYVRMTEAVDEGKRISTEDIEVSSLETMDFKTFDKPLKLGNFVPWADLFKTMGNVYVLICILAILICSVVFSGDTAKNINQLLLTTKFGRNQLNISKIFAGMSLSLGLFILLQLINFGVFFLMYDTSGWDSSIQTNLSLGLFHFPIELNHLQIYFVLLGIQVLGLVFVAGVTLMISALTKSPLSALAVSLSIYFIPKLLTQLFKAGLVNKVLYLFPINNADASQTLSLLSSEHEFLLNGFAQNLLLESGILVLAAGLLILGTYHYMNRWRFT